MLSTLFAPHIRSWRHTPACKGANKAISPTWFQQLPHISGAAAASASNPAEENDVEGSDAADTLQSRTIFRKDYRPSDFTVDWIELTLQLDEEATTVGRLLPCRAQHLKKRGTNPGWTCSVLCLCLLQSETSAQDMVKGRLFLLLQ